MKPATLIDSICVRHHECDPTGHLKLHALLDYLQDAAAIHAQQMGFGMEDLQRTGLIWVLSRLKLTIEQMPRLGEKLTVETYPTGLEKLFATRQYCVRNSDRILVKGTSAWLILDRETYQILPPVRVLELEMPRNENAERFHPLPGKICAPERIDSRRSYLVGHADIDLNDHLNNAVYARYLTDLFENNPIFNEVQFNFLRAGQLGDQIACALTLASDGTFYCDGIAKDDTRFFQATGSVKPQVSCQR